MNSSARREVNEEVEPSGLNLPAGYDYTLTRKRGLTPFWRVVAAVLMIAIGTVVFLGGPGGLLLFAVFVMPVIIGAYFIFLFLTARKERAPAARRRFRLSPKLQKPAQTRHHWTVDSSEYRDPELYRQDDARPRISREPEENSD